MTLPGSSGEYAVEFYPNDPAGRPRRFEGPIGFDGLYRKGHPTGAEIFAARGRWLDGATLEIERQVVGMDDLQKWTLSFAAHRLTLHGKDSDGGNVSVESDPRR
jgi:hypothetical protein